MSVKTILVIVLVPVALAIPMVLVKLVVRDGSLMDETTVAFSIEKAPGSNGDNSPGFGSIVALASVVFVAVLMAIASRRR